jgi:arabinan endo-1,5-alpha-L-arabinosidase
MRTSMMTTALVAAGVLSLAGCGGSDGDATAVTGTAAKSGGAPQEAVASSRASFAEVSVHDPSVIRANGQYYVFGSHLAAAKTPDLMHWTKIAEGVNPANPLIPDVANQLAETFAWAQTSTLWAPDVIRMDDGKYYMYYNACKGDSPRSALGIAVADHIEGPYINKGIFLKSGMWGEVSPDGTIYDATRHPNVVDPNVFRDTAGKLWMIYGSYSGGIFILQLDKANGMPLPGQGYGKHLMGGNHSRIEGAYVLYSPESKYYYMFTSFGGLDANGAYNMRVARSRNPDGPYVDGRGTDMATVKSDPTKPLFDDASIAPHGQKLLGNHQFALAAGETSTPLGYVSAGHNSAFYDAATKQHFLIFHTRFPNTGEMHEVRVHEMFINEEGWPVVAPFRYAPPGKAKEDPKSVGAAAVAGTYKFINHGKDITAAIRQSQVLKLGKDGRISGAVSGRWSYRGNNRFSLALDGTAAPYSGVLSRQWNSNANAFTVTFTAQNADGVSVWGARTGN